MRQWIIGIAAASLLSSMAMAATPPGRVRQVTRLACGLMCALAVASPVLKLDMTSLALGLAAYEMQAGEIRVQAEEETKMLNRTYIEEQLEAYILGKAAEKGAAVDGVDLSARWDSEELLWYPWQVTVDGAYDAGLSSVIEAELGIPRERQDWRDDE